MKLNTNGSYRTALSKRVMKRHPSKDVLGQKISVGDMVRVIGVPDLSGMTAACRAESLPVFQYLVGKYKRVEEFDQYGFAWLSFKIRKGPQTGYHLVGLEPHLLKVRQPRKP